MVKLRAMFVIVAGIAVMLLLAFGFAPLLASYDVRRVAAHQEPTFCWSRWVGAEQSYLDGGTRIHRGFGYEVLAKHRIISGPPTRYDTGVAVSFTLPWYKRYDSETVIESDR